jgi:hypothetical protein
MQHTVCWWIEIQPSLCNFWFKNHSTNYIRVQLIKSVLEKICRLSEVLLLCSESEELEKRRVKLEVKRVTSNQSIFANILL